MRLFMADNDIVFTGTGLQLIGNENGRILIADKNVQAGRHNTNVRIVDNPADGIQRNLPIDADNRQTGSKKPLLDNTVYPKSYFSFP